MPCWWLVTVVFFNHFAHVWSNSIGCPCSHCSLSINGLTNKIIVENYFEAYNFRSGCYFRAGIKYLFSPSLDIPPYITFISAFYLLYSGYIGDVPIMLAKPQTFMNASGESVSNHIWNSLLLKLSRMNILMVQFGFLHEGWFACFIFQNTTESSTSGRVSIFFFGSLTVISIQIVFFC